MMGGMMDKAFGKWWLGRVMPFREVPMEKLAAEREAVTKQAEYNGNYQQFLQGAVLPTIDQVVTMLRKNQITHRVSTWGNQLALRIHLAWRWGELVVMQGHEDCVTFEHHIITEGEKRGEDSAEDHAHDYDLRDPLPATVAQQELMFFLGRIALVLVASAAEFVALPGAGVGLCGGEERL